MSRHFSALALVALIALVSGCGKQETGSVAGGGANTPDGTIMKSAALLKQADIAGLMQNALPPDEFAKVKADWGKDANDKPVTDEDRRKFEDAMTKLTEPGADQKIYAEIEPQLKQFDAQYQQQMPMYVSMGSGWLQGMVQQNKNLSDADKQQANAAIKALADWVQKTRFTDPDSVKKVLGIVTQAARELDLKTLDQARALSFDQSMQKAHVAVLALKNALAVYGFSLDDTLDSIHAKVVSSDGKAAKVQVSYTLLGTPLTANANMVNVDGRWYGKETIEKIKEKQDAAKAAATTEPAADGDKAAVAH